jgi:hypothetical protein
MGSETEDFLRQFSADQTAPKSTLLPPTSTEGVSNAVPNSVEDFLAAHARGESVPNVPFRDPNKLPPPSEYANKNWYTSKDDKPFDYSSYESYLPDPNSIIGKGIANFPKSLGHVGTDLVQGLTHPFEAAEGLRSIVSGGFSTGMENLGIKPGFGVSTPKGKDLERYVREKEAYGNVAQGISDTINVPGYFKRNVAEKPMETLMDVSPFLGAGSKVLGTAAKVLPEGAIASGVNIASKGLDIASKANPVDLSMIGASKAIEGGLKYGVGPGAGFFSVPGNSIHQAYIAGKEGSPRFLSQYFGLQGDESLYNLAKSGLNKMYNAKETDYLKMQKALEDVSNKGQRLDYQPMLDRIGQEYGSKVDSRTGARNLSYDQIELLDKMSQEIRERSMRDPEQFDLAHTAKDMDDFKKLFYQTFQHKADKLQLNHVFNDIYGNMGDQIKAVAPFYSDAMSNYGAQKAEIASVLRGLKLGGNDKEAALQKLFQKGDNTKNLIDTLSNFEPDLKNAIAGRDLRLFQGPPGMQGASRLGGYFLMANPLAYPGLYGGIAYPAGLGMSATQKAVLPGAYYGEQGREGRASGGKVDHKSAEAISDQLVSAFANAKKNEDLESKVLLNKPDDVIIDALKEAKKAI